MSLILHIDTAGTTASVFLASEKSVLEQQFNNSQKDHAAFLHPAIEQLCRESGNELNDLDAVAVAAGPGSYTGLRVGFSAAKGLAYALSKPLIPVSSLQIMALAAQRENINVRGLYCPMIDARRNEIFTALYDNELNELACAQPQLLENLSGNFFPATETVFFFGSGAKKYAAMNETSSHVQIPDGNSNAAFAACTFREFSIGRFADNLRAAPLYAKPFFGG